MRYRVNISCPLPGKQNHESLKDQLCVKHEAPVVNILEIKVDHFIEISAFALLLLAKRH